MKFTELKKEAQDFLNQLKEGYANDAESMPIYLRQGDEAIFIEDFPLPVKANGEFEKGAAQHDLYRGGAMTMVYSEHGQLVTFDDRQSWWKPIAAGIAKFEEGDDLMKAAKRELLEELWVLSCFSKEQRRFVPNGYTEDSLSHVDLLGYDAQIVELETAHQFMKHVFNDKNRAYECVASWNLENIPGPWTALNEEDAWFLPGKAGLVLSAIDEDGNLNGFFSGQQGFVPAGTNKLHVSIETLKE